MQARYTAFMQTTENTRHLHSSEYLALAQAADQNFWDIIVVAKRPPSDGTNPAAWCIIRQEGRSETYGYAVTMGVVNEDGEGFFCSSIYDVDLPRAMEILAQKVALDHTE